MHRTLWSIQWILASLFLVAGAEKLVLPMEDVAQQFGMPVNFLLFIGCMEMLGALGLILPGLLKIQTGLTPLAAAGLVPIMVGAVVITIQAYGLLMALIPFTTGCLAGFVAYGRWRIAPLPGK